MPSCKKSELYYIFFIPKYLYTYIIQERNFESGQLYPGGPLLGRLLYSMIHIGNTFVVQEQRK